MLPPGHIAAGYLTAEALLKFSHASFTPKEFNELLCWGMFWGFAPDLDVFYFFFKHKTLLVAGQDAATDSHRKFFSHTPLYWLIAGLAVYFFGPTLYWKYVGLLLWLGSWSHFLLDSIEYGIPWLNPFSDKLFAFKALEYKLVVKDKNFFCHSINFLKMYGSRLSFYIEVLIIIVSLAIYFRI